jgi:hypothetical protein
MLLAPASGIIKGVYPLLFLALTSFVTFRKKETKTVRLKAFDIKGKFCVVLSNTVREYNLPFTRPLQESAFAEKHEGEGIFDGRFSEGVHRRTKDPLRNCEAMRSR